MPLFNDAIERTLFVECAFRIEIAIRKSLEAKGANRARVRWTFSPDASVRAASVLVALYLLPLARSSLPHHLNNEFTLVAIRWNMLTVRTKRAKVGARLFPRFPKSNRVASLQFLNFPFL